jgi:hypothetical protein
MAHAFEGKTATFLHNGDYSGKVGISTVTNEIWVSFEDIKNFMAEYIRGQRIAALEDMSADELLKGDK